MAGRFPRNDDFVSLPKNALRVGLASLMLLATGVTSVHNATANGDTRELSFHHTHSDESLTVVFKRNGRYDEGALKKLNHFLRDWRSQDSTTMDRRLFDILWEVYRDVDGKQPIKIISAYRSPATNAMLRRRSSGVARFSQHMQGQAIDFFIPGVPLEQIRFAGLRLQRGGVGFYPTSGSPFVHLDVGSIRHWPRMNYDQLARVFPDGRTVHVPSNGKPLAGYQLALADIEKRGDGSEAVAPSKTKSLIASLFGRKQMADDEEESAPTVQESKSSSKSEVATVAPKAEKIAEAVPMPRAKPASANATYQVASAASQPIVLEKPKAASPARSDTVVDVINARGFWDNEPTAPKPTAPQIANAKARETIASADPQSTASLNSNVSQALAYAPPTSPLDKSQIVAASAPIPRMRATSPAANPMSASVPAANETTIAKAQPGGTATIVRVGKWEMNEIWLRAMILTPNATTTLSAAILGDQDMTVMRAYFVKPRVSVAMTFSDDPHLGMVCDRFTGPAVAALKTMSFGIKTAALR